MPPRPRSLTPAPLQRPISVGEQLGAAFQLDNLLANVAMRAAEPDVAAEAEADFDFQQHLLPGEELVADQFEQANSPAEMRLIRARIERERGARFALEQGPLNAFLASTIAIAADPTTFLPLAGAALTRGRALTKIAGAAAGSAVDVGLSEIVLQNLQETRTTTESLAAVILGGAFGMGIAGTVVGVSTARANRAYTRAVEDFTALGESIPESTAGAQARPRPSPEDTRLAGGKGVRAAIRGFSKVLEKLHLAAPSLELSVSRFARSRELVQRLVDTGLITEGQVKGLTGGAALETRIKRHEAVIVDAFRMLNRAFKAHRKAGGQLKRQEFFEEVGRAMRRSDESAVPGVGDAAKNLRSHVFDPYKDAAIGQKLLAEDVDVTTAASYFSRVYNKDLIIAQRQDFKGRIVEWLETQFKPEDLPAGRQELGVIADSIIDTILGTPSGRVPLFNVPAKRGPLRERTFNIPDELIEDFLVSNALEVTARYVRTLAADIEFSKEFGRTDLADELKALRDEINEGMEAAKTERERKSIRAEGDRQEALLEALGDRIRGVTREPSDPRMLGMIRLGRFARNLNFLRLLGSVTLSSIPDVGLIVMREGLLRTFGTVFTQAARGFREVRMAGNEAQLAGTATDMVNNQRAAALLDLGDRYVSESKFERGLGTAANTFGMLTLLSPWNYSMKAITSLMVSTRILGVARRLAAGKKISKADTTRLAEAGISREMAERIAKQAEHWDEAGGVITGNTAAWTDAGAVDTFRNALLRDVDNTILTPGAGDAPLWTTTEWGKTIFQFKRFAMASTQRILLSSLQRRDMATLNGLMVMAGMGAMGTALRDISSAGEVKERTTPQWIAEAVDRSGMASIFFEMDGMAEKVLGVGAVSALTGQEVSRFAQRDVAGQVLGPTAGLVFDTIPSAAAGLLKGQFTQSDLHRFRRLFPGQNVFYVRYLLDQAEEAANLPQTDTPPARRRALPVQP